MNISQRQTAIYCTITTINIFGILAKMDWIGYLSKPLLMISLGYFYYNATKNNIQFKDKLTLSALLFSCFGDCFLLFEKAAPYYFLLGLASFLVAHLFYIYLFSQKTKFKLLRIIPFAAFGIFMLYVLMSNISGSFKIPVFAYITVITIMGIMAISRENTPKSYQLVLLGAILFAISDSFIGINKFVNPIPFAQVWIKATYITAQYLIIKGVLLDR